MVDEEDWEELAGRPRKGRQSKKQRKKRTKTEQLDAEYQRAEQNKFLQGLNDNQGRYEWMKEKRYNTMFRDIESKIQGALGTGTYDWVDRRVFDQVFDRLTLMALYKIMKSGVVDTLDFPGREERRPCLSRHQPRWRTRGGNFPHLKCGVQEFDPVH